MAGFIEDEAKYEAAVRRRIRENQIKGTAPWRAENRDLLDFIDMKNNGSSPFFKAMAEAVEQYGKITEKQQAVCEKMMVEDTAKKSERKAAAIARDAGSRHIGTVGARQDFTLTIRHVIQLDGEYGISYIHLMNDQNGNVVVYKGTVLLAKSGETLNVKATIKDHGERDGIAQTMISRPKAV